MPAQPMVSLTDICRYNVRVNWSLSETRIRQVHPKQRKGSKISVAIL
jgi:hypothetical protein